MSDRVLAPIIVGITGKRELSGKDAALRDVLAACFDLLDRDFPSSPKILLSAAAIGADSVAANAAIDRENWRVAAVLPLEQELYEEDFDGDELAAFRTLVADQRVRTIVLDPLRDPDTREPYARDALSRPAEKSRSAEKSNPARADSAKKSNPLRADHYEQVGLYIAERASVLIGVMPAGEPPRKIGGTARVVDYCVRGPDAIARRIIEASYVLRQGIVLDSLQTGPALLIDLDAVATAGPPLRAVELWKPGFSEHHGSVDVKVIKGARAHRHLARDFVLAARMDVLNRRIRNLDDAVWTSEVEDRARRDEAKDDAPNASGILRRLRAALSTLQGGDKERIKTTVAALGVLFLATVLVLELEKFEFSLALGLYVVLFVLTLLIFVVARSGRLQQYTEDYRAVSEALRVQVVWWDAGLSGPDHRVDSLYLFAASGSLGLVRAAIRYLIDAALLLNDPPTPTPTPGADTKWIDGQALYFERRTEERKHWLELSHDLVWFLFVASFGMALTLLTNQVFDLSNVVEWLNGAPRAIETPLILLVPVALFFAAHQLSRTARRALDRQNRRALRGLFWTVAGVAGVALFFGVFPLTPAVSRLAAWMHGAGIAMNLGDVCPPAASSPGMECILHLGPKLVVTLAILVTAMAGALRFYVENLAFEPELHRYRESLLLFRRAQKELAGLGREGPDRAKRQQLLLALGTKALEENEAWIRVRRIRVLEPRL